MPETLGDGIGRVILDDRHEEIRQRIRTVKSGSSGEHLVAGLKGLGFGLLGGVTSLVRQTYDGAATDGFQVSRIYFFHLGMNPTTRYLPSYQPTEPTSYCLSLSQIKKVFFQSTVACIQFCDTP